MSARHPEPHFWTLVTTLTGILLALGIGGGASAFISGGFKTGITKPPPAAGVAAAAGTVPPAPPPPQAASAGATPPPLATGAPLDAQKQAGQQVYMTVCFACHQPTGLGMPNMFPPLAGSDWLAAKRPDRLIRMVLFGVSGPISVKGAPFATPAPLMPPQGAALTDDQIANVLTFVRNSFGNSAPAVKPDDVAAIRASESKRTAPWTEAELKKIPVE